MDFITYAILKKVAAGAVSGISDLEVQGQDLIITLENGKVLKMSFPTPKDGVSIQDVKVENNELKVTLSDGTEIDAGTITTLKGDKGERGEPGEQGPPGEKGDTPKKGVDYFTPEDIQDVIEAFEAQEQYATKEDIDKMFENSGTDAWATKEDIDKMFEDSDIDSWATREDIDGMFE